MLRTCLLTYTGTVALQVFAAGDQEPRVFSCADRSAVWVLEQILVTWKEGTQGAAGVDSGIWT